MNRGNVGTGRPEPHPSAPEGRGGAGAGALLKQRLLPAAQRLPWAQARLPGELPGPPVLQQCAGCQLLRQGRKKYYKFFQDPSGRRAALRPVEKEQMLFCHRPCPPLMLDGAPCCASSSSADPGPGAALPGHCVVATLFVASVLRSARRREPSPEKAAGCAAWPWPGVTGAGRSGSQEGCRRPAALLWRGLGHGSQQEEMPGAGARCLPVH